MPAKKPKIGRPFSVPGGLVPVTVYLPKKIAVAIEQRAKNFHEGNLSKAVRGILVQWMRGWGS